jgi:hypothetical protein
MTSSAAREGLIAAFRFDLRAGCWRPPHRGPASGCRPGLRLLLLPGGAGLRRLPPGFGIAGRATREPADGRAEAFAPRALGEPRERLLSLGRGGANAVLDQPGVCPSRWSSIIRSSKQLLSVKRSGLRTRPRRGGCGSRQGDTFMRQRVLLGELLVPVSDRDDLGASAWCTTDCGCGRCRVRDAAACRWRSTGIRVPWAST